MEKLIITVAGDSRTSYPHNHLCPTQEDIPGVTQQYVSGLERGERNPTVVTLYHLATALGVSPVELVMPDDEARQENAKPAKRKSRNK